MGYDIIIVKERGTLGKTKIEVPFHVYSEREEEIKDFLYKLVN